MIGVGPHHKKGEVRAGLYPLGLEPRNTTPHVFAARHAAGRPASRPPCRRPPRRPSRRPSHQCCCPKSIFYFFILVLYFGNFWLTIQNTTNRHVSNAFDLLAVFISFPLARAAAAAAVAADICCCRYWAPRCCSLLMGSIN